MFEYKKRKKTGPDRESNPEPRAPEARIIPLDHQASVISNIYLHLLGNL